MARPTKNYKCFVNGVHEYSGTVYYLAEKYDIHPNHLRKRVEIIENGAKYYE